MCAPLVNVKEGTLRGTVFENINGGQYYSFLGIPYARPPIGELRFQDPQPPLPWKGIRDAQKEGQVSVQFRKRTDTIIGSEDCLFLNVSTNSLSGKRPVIVSIHGGRFRTFCGNRILYAPDYLLEHDVVFVSINFRLGILGHEPHGSRDKIPTLPVFFCPTTFAHKKLRYRVELLGNYIKGIKEGFLNMEIESCPGNQAFKDQIFALRWIQENIEAFGGDKDNVTISGISSGGNCAHYLSLSPLAKGLVHKAIIQSGIVDHTLAYRETNKNFGFKIAAFLGKETSNSKEAVEFLRTLSLSDIMQTFKKIKAELPKLEDFFCFGPTWDKMSKNPFTPRSLPELIKQGIDIPLIIGFTSHEGMRFLRDEDCYIKLQGNFENHLAEYMGPERQDVIKIPRFVDAIKEFYFKDESTSTKQAENLVNYTGDLHYSNPIQMCIEKQMKKSTATFVYLFSYQPENSIFSMYYPHVNTRGLRGTAHSDEWPFIYRMCMFEPDFTVKNSTKDNLVMQRITKMWTDFAKTGNPTPKTDDLITEKWLPITSNRKYYMDIGDELKSSENPRGEFWNFWKSWNVYN